jgi:hypothetical protein
MRWCAIRNRVLSQQGGWLLGYGGCMGMVRVLIRLNGSKVSLGEGLVSIEVADVEALPVFLVQDEEGGKAETFHLAYQEGRWKLADYGSITDPLEG